MKNASPQLVGTRTDLLELLLQVHGVVVLEDVLGHPAVTDTLQTAFFLNYTVPNSVADPNHSDPAPTFCLLLSGSRKKNNLFFLLINVKN